MYRPRLLLIVLLFPLLAAVSRPAVAFEEINKSFLGDVALGGFDAVNYFTEGKAKKGDKAVNAGVKTHHWPE